MLGFDHGIVKIQKKEVAVVSIMITCGEKHWRLRVERRGV